MATPLLLVVHGRSGGVIPAEWETLAAELRQRRSAPVWLQALTAAEPPEQVAEPSAACLTLVPLFLLPGNHVRFDLPAVAEPWSRSGPLRRLAFLGAWPRWQQALAEELGALNQVAGAGPPLLLHHPIEGPLARRYLAHLEAITGARCRPMTYGEADPELAGSAPGSAVLPLALAANRLTEGLAAPWRAPLLARPRCRQVLLELLAALA